MKGKIIVLLGSPASGKTTLATKLAEYYHGVVFYEEPKDGFPIEIQECMRTNTRIFELNMWFQTRQVENYMEALKAADEGKIVVMDSSPFYETQFYISAYDMDPFYKDLLYKIGEQDLQLLPPANCTVYIETTPETMKQFLERRKGKWNWEQNKSWLEFLVKMPLHCSDFMRKVEPTVPNLVKLKREEFDVFNPEDSKSVIQKIDDVLFSKK